MNRLELYKTLEEKRNSKIIVYATSDRRGLETQISPDILSPFANHLDAMGETRKISLLLYTRGGNTLTAWSLVNLIRNYCEDFEIIIPFHCHSAGTLISLGANRILMTKQATLGPIDPSVNGPLNPQIPNNPNARVPVSVEFVDSYLNLAKKELNISDDATLGRILTHLADKIHPLTIGQVYRSKEQIKMLAKKLIKNQGLTPEREDKIVQFLSSDSGSHDYTIHRNEAIELGLNIDLPTADEYPLIKGIYQTIESDLKLRHPFDPKLIIGNNNNVQYTTNRAIIESVSGGRDVFISEGMLVKQVMKQNTPQGPIQKNMIQDNRLFEGWRHF